MNGNGQFTAPTIGGNADNIGQDLNSVAPLATSWGGPSVGVDTMQVVRNASNTPQESDLSKFGSFLGNIASETGHIAAQAGQWLFDAAKNFATFPIREGAGFGNLILQNMSLDSINKQSQQNSELLQNTMQAYKSGQMSKANYLRALKDIAQTSDGLVSQNSAVQNQININQKATVQATWDTATGLITVLTAGFGAAATTEITSAGLTASAAQSAGDFLMTKAAPFLARTSGFISHIAANPEAFGALNDAAKLALQRSTAEVVTQATNMTGSQIAKAAAANVALKYPLTYGFLEPTATDFYNQLDNKKYGDAVQTLAFNALLLLSGGAIGQALKYGGKALGAISERTFGQTSFWDELSKFYDQGQPNGFRDAVVKMTEGIAPEDKAAFLKNLSAVEATNMAAMGNDAVAAANRVAKGLAFNEGVDLSTITHEDALHNMVTYAENQRLADEAAKAAGIGRVIVGRLDTRAKKMIAEAVSQGEDTASRLKAWEDLKAQNTQQAWANNDNFDAQIKNMIANHENPAELQGAIKSIAARTTIKGIPQDVLDKMAADGYIPMKMKANDAAFAEGNGKFVSSFAQEGDLWTKSVQPLPILGPIGDALTAMGMSPLNATRQVYDMYNTNLAMNLEKSSVWDIFKAGNTTEEQTSDTIIKRLSDYAHNPTSGGITLPNGTRLRAPITDLRQLTTNDIMKALDVNASQAKEVAGALMDSMLQVPLDIRGLGGKIEDLNLKYNPTSKWLARTQGAGRFAWNPFFQMKLAYKTEALTQLEAGGKFPTILGTNKILSVIFPEHYAQLDEIRTALRDAGIFDQASHAAIGGEGVSDITQASANLTHKLLPSQERSIAGLVATQADKVGLSPQQFAEQFPSQVRDTVQMIAQYDRNAQFLNSPMARTLNFAFFPFRFETKVATLTAKALAKTSPMTQFAVIKGFYNANQFLNSPQGQAWYSQNAEVIKLLQYFTPLSTLASVSNILGGKADSVGSFGELGGLPLGWIPQMLDAEGVSQQLFGHPITQSAYLDPKTGQELANYVPVTARGTLLVALQDFIGQLFTYPGAEAGLPAKSKITRGLATELTGADTKTDLQKAPLQPLSPDQQNFQQTVQALNGAGSNSNLSTGAPFTAPSIGVPAQSTPITTPAPRSAPKLRKSQFKPAPLP